MNSPGALSAHLQSSRFDRFELRPRERLLLVDGTPVHLGARAFDLLVALAARPGQLVSKNELLELVWPGLVVEENNLQVQVSALRKLLGPQVIATIPGRGYRFAAAFDGAANERQSANLPEAAPAEVHAGVPIARRSNLPADLPPLYGRDADLASLRELLDAHALVTVVGAGGIGKSRLAQAMAHQLIGSWPDGAWMVELAGLADPALLANAVAQVLDIKLAGQAAAIDELVAGMAPRSLLLVLDNCEHLLDAVAALAQSVLRDAPNVRLLTTSQEPLHLPAEQQYRIMPLPVPGEAAAGDRRAFGAIALFEARVQAADPRFTLTDENLPLVADICRRLDGLPLAIELAAARVATLGLRPVRDKLDARFKLLTGGARATLRRHQTLRAALEWSHGLLNDAERAVFRRLGVFAGGFTVELAQAVAANAGLDEWAVLDHLSALVDKSLVVADAGDTPRYRLLESARAFALEELASGETAATLRRHAKAMLRFLQGIDDANIDGELRTDEYAALVLPELDNLRAAHAWASGAEGEPQVAIALAAHAGSLIDYAVECVGWLQAVRRIVEDGGTDSPVAARYWRALAAGNMAGSVPLALQVEAAVRATALYRQLGRPRRLFSSLVQLARHIHAPQYAEAAQAALDEARRLIRSDWPAEFRIVLLRRDAFIARLEGRHAEALALFREGIHASRASGDWRLEVMARGNLVDMLWETRPLDEAAREVRALVEDLQVKPAADADMDVAYANAMSILSEMGHIDEAAAIARTALPLMRRTQNFFLESWLFLFWRDGQFDVAARLLGASDAVVKKDELPLQPNEARLVAQVRADLATRLGSEALDSALAAGAALGKGALFGLISAALDPAIPGHE